jgi:chromate transport protein ChrA
MKTLLWIAKLISSEARDIFSLVKIFFLPLLIAKVLRLSFSEISFVDNPSTIKPAIVFIVS